MCRAATTRGSLLHCGCGGATWHTVCGVYASFGMCVSPFVWNGVCVLTAGPQSPPARQHLLGARRPPSLKQRRLGRRHLYVTHIPNKKEGGTHIQIQGTHTRAQRERQTSLSFLACKSTGTN